MGADGVYYGKGEFLQRRSGELRSRMENGKRAKPCDWVSTSIPFISLFKVAVCLHERSCKVFPKTERRDLKRKFCAIVFLFLGKSKINSCARVRVRA